MIVTEFELLPKWQSCVTVITGSICATLILPESHSGVDLVTAIIVHFADVTTIH